MPDFKIYKNLAEINELSTEQSLKLFQGLSGSKAWAAEMTERRPFRMVSDLFEAAEKVWFSLAVADRLEVFRSTHESASRNGRAPASGSAEPVSVMDVQRRLNDPDLSDALELYRQKFGFEFILYTPGKDIAEITAICNARRGNSMQTELEIAAHEEGKIQEVKLRRLLEK
jgi:2-oxo-4-hydroxy-4-carboxy--5-ureidoimidazoline (OHCU) decarboxylase